MPLPQDQIDEVKRMFGEVRLGEEVGLPYLLFPNLTLPAGCTPAFSDVLLCPVPHPSGYPSRIFFPNRIATRENRNWNGQFFILGRNWVAFSWNIQTNPPQPTTPRLAQMLLLHLRALR
jgi:hypothetical protein